jgi:anti-anti-sigma factor
VGAEDFLFTFGEKIYIGNVDHLQPMIVSRLQDPLYGRVILDLRNVRMCDSQGIRMLLNLQRKAAEAGKGLVLYRPDAILREVLEYTKIAHVFTITDDLPDQSKDELPEPGTAAT